MWQDTEQGLYKQFSFIDFAQAFAFMTGVAELAERQQHHPRWTNEWNTVEIWLISHDAGNIITDKDRTLAAAIDQLVAATKTDEDN
jgi:4a-hydroxytetrahydrobiopterin dehydratase